MALALMTVIHVCSGLANPFGINRLLLYLETKGKRCCATLGVDRVFIFSAYHWKSNT